MAGSRSAATRGMMMSRALKSIGEAKTLSASAPEFFAASIAPGTSSTYTTR
jgi:hypothetical protein